MTSKTATTINDETKETMNNNVLPSIISSTMATNIHIDCESSNDDDQDHNDNKNNNNDETILKKNEGTDNNNTNFIQIDGIKFVDYQDESQLDHVMSLVGRDLSEPYSIFTYRYFLYRFPQLCILAIDIETNEPIGCVVGKIDPEEVISNHNDNNNNTNSNDSNHHPATSSASTSMTGPAVNTDHTTATTITAESTSTITYVGYIGMLAVSEKYRRRGIGKALVQRILHRFKYMDNNNNPQSTMKCTSVILETEVTNHTAQLLYQNYFGFIREELLVRYYLNWNDAYRLRLWF